MNLGRTGKQAQRMMVVSSPMLFAAVFSITVEERGIGLSGNRNERGAGETHFHRPTLMMEYVPSDV